MYAKVKKSGNTKTVVIMNENFQDLSEKEFELIESFVLGEMTASEMQNVELRMAQDKTFADEVAQQRALIKAVQEKNTLKKKIHGFHTQMEKASTINKQADQPKINFRWQKLAIAASLVLGISALSFWFLNKAPQHEQLFKQYFEPDPGLPTLMGEKNDENFAFLRAMVDYKQANYALAIEKWETQHVEKNENDTLIYYLGVAHLTNGNTVAAIDFLKKEILLESKVFADEAYYYLGFAFLKQGDVATAKEYFAKSKLEKSKNLIPKLKNN